MAVLNLTPRGRMVDGQGRPYFLWDSEMILERFEDLLRRGNPDTRTYLLGKLMRQARPDDVFQFVTMGEIREQWSRVERYLGRTRPFWTWLVEAWKS